MDSVQFLEKSQKKLFSSYDLEEQKTLRGLHADLYAYYNERVSKYVISKKNEFFVFQNTEIILFKVFDQGFDETNLAGFYNYLENEVEHIVDIHKEHMSTTIKLVVWSEQPISKEVRKKIKKFKFYKSFNRGLQGWVNGAVISVEKDSHAITASRFAKQEARHLFNKKFFKN